MKYVLFLLLLLGSPILTAQDIPASGKELLKRSIAYHDPDGLLTSGETILKLNEPRPGGEDRITTLEFKPAISFFSVNRKVGTDEIYMVSENDVFSYTLNGQKEATAEQIEKFKLTKERLDLLFNYYQYLWFLPGKLNDPGTIVHDDIHVKDFFGKKGYELKITYEPGVGKDTWYFYFDQQHYGLVGYRFYHDESKNDGEYILLEGELQNNGVKIPATRKWYKHVDDSYLGQDILVELKISKPKS